MGFHGDTMVKIFNTDWEVKEVLMEEDGITFFGEQVIHINKDLHSHRKRLALTHELLHVVCDNVGIKEDEEIISRIEAGVFELIKKFPEGYK